MRRYADYGNDPSIHQSADGRWYHTPRSFGPKLAFLIGSLLVVALGTWIVWDPLMALVAGERGAARVVQITRFEPGQEPRRIRHRQTIPEGTHHTRFDYTVEVITAEGDVRTLRLAVGSARVAYANINDEFEVIFREGAEHAYGLHHHRTWAFGIGFLFVGGVLTLCAVPTLLAVGKPIEIDPEAEQT